MKNAIGLFVALALLAWGAATPAATRDLSKILVGTWKGQVQVSATKEEGDSSHEMARMLVIESVQQENGKWAGKAKFGTADKLTPVDLTIETPGNDVVLSFHTRARSLVKLTLRQPTSLVGSLQLDGGAGKGFPLKLDKSK